MICPNLVQCVSSLLGKPLFVLKQLFAFSFSGSFMSALPPTHGGGGGAAWTGWGLGGGPGKDCMVGACGRLCCSIERALGGSRGFRRPCMYDPPPPLPPTRDRGQGLW